MNSKLVAVLMVAAVIFSSALTYKTVTMRYESEIYRLKKEAEIFRSQADNYAKTIKIIKEAAESATPVSTPESKI